MCDTRHGPPQASTRARRSLHWGLKLVKSHVFNLCDASYSILLPSYLLHVRQYHCHVTISLSASSSRSNRWIPRCLHPRKLAGNGRHLRRLLPFSLFPFRSIFSLSIWGGEHPNSGERGHDNTLSLGHYYASLWASGPLLCFSMGR